MGGALKAIGGLVSAIAPIASLIPGVGTIIGMLGPIAGGLLEKVGGGLEGAEEKAKEGRRNDAKMAANQQAANQDMGGAEDILGKIMNPASLLGGLFG